MKTCAGVQLALNIAFATASLSACAFLVTSLIPSVAVEQLMASCQVVKFCVVIGSIIGVDTALLDGIPHGSHDVDECLLRGRDAAWLAECGT